MWSVLTGQAYDNTPTIVLHDVKEIETWILRLLSAPVPVPGKTRVELEVLSPTAHSPLLFALPDHTRFSLVDFPLHLPLELLGEWEGGWVMDPTSAKYMIFFCSRSKKKAVVAL